MPAGPAGASKLSASKKPPKKDSTPKKGSPNSKEGTPKRGSASKSPHKSLQGAKRKRNTPEKPSRSGECKNANLLC